MFRLIVEKELREIIGSMKFAVTFGISSLLLLLTFYIGARNYQVSAEQNEAALRENLRTLDGLTEWDEVQKSRVFLPPQPVSSLVMGVSNDMGGRARSAGSARSTPATASTARTRSTRCSVPRS